VTTGRPAVPRSSDLDPLVDEIPVGTALTRIYDRRWGPLGFNPTDSPARFRPVHDARDSVVPTAYLASDVETALAETVLRGVTALSRLPASRPMLFSTQVDPLDLCSLVVQHPIRAARLHGQGLTRLRLLREHVIDCDAADYPYTAGWAQALWGSRRRPHGISWTSRQNDSGKAYVLWETRLHADTLAVHTSPVRLDRDPGRDLVRRACVAADIDFEG
jgi:hypothetical protein